MSIDRFKKRNKLLNINSLYYDTFKKRNVDFINHFSSPKYDYNLEETGFEVTEHLWGFGDRVYKIAEYYYGDPSLWWIISFVNQKPTEHDFKEGDLILIPNSPNKVLEFMGV